MSRDIFEQVRFFKRRGVPIIAINSVDPIALTKELAYRLSDHPVFTWDICVGIEPGRKRNPDNAAAPLANELSDRTWQQLGPVVSAMSGAHGQQMKGIYETQAKGVGLDKALQLAREIPSSTGQAGAKLCPVFICKHVNQLLHGTSGHATQQAIMNIRDYYAATGRTLILIDNDIELPECLRADTIVLEESLPTQEEYRASVEKICRSAKIKAPKDLQPVVDAVAGLPLFQAEQALSLSLTSEGFDIQILWAEKKKLVDQTQGLSVHYQGEGFKGVGGLQGIKNYVQRLMKGPKPPQLIVWIDEIEKTGIAHTGDLNGINADTLGVMLSYIEDHNAYCVSLTGLPGTGKSMIAKSMGAEFGRMVIRMDLGAMKGSFVGQSIHPEEEIYVCRKKNGYDSRRFTMEEFHRVWESGDRDWYTWTHSNVGGSIISRVTDSIKHDRAVRFVKITTRSGREVVATENHSVFKKRRHIPEDAVRSKSFKAMNEEVSQGLATLELHRQNGIFEEADAGSLVVGEKIAIASKYTTNLRNKSNYKVSVGGVTIEATPDFCQLLGLWLADGCWLGDSVRISCNQDETDTIEFVKRMFGEGKCNQYQNPGSQGIDIYASTNHWICLAFRMLGIRGRSRTKRIPEWVYGLPLDSQRALLRGYFNGDGSISGHVLEASTMSSCLAKDIVRLLASVGIFARCRSKWVKPEGTIRGKDFKAKEGRRYRITISKGLELMTFSEHVGFISKKKQDTLQNLLSNYNIKRYSPGKTNYGVLWDEVESIEFVNGPDHCYDISVDETEKFVCGGIIVHNTESNLRASLRVITSLGQDNVLFLATSNTINSLDAALRSRFRDTFYFPLPTSEELKPVWGIHMAKYGMTGEIPDDTNWVPRNVKHCIEKAYRLGMPLAEAAETVIPTGQSMANEVQKLNEQASGRFLDASTGKVFGA